VKLQIGQAQILAPVRRTVNTTPKCSTNIGSYKLKNNPEHCGHIPFILSSLPLPNI